MKHIFIVTSFNLKRKKKEWASNFQPIFHPHAESIGDNLLPTLNPCSIGDDNKRNFLPTLNFHAESIGNAESIGDNKRKYRR